MLYQLLVACTKGEAKNYVRNTERSFKAWKQIFRHFDPRTGADRSVAYSRVTRPVSPSGITPTRPKTLQASRTTMHAWEQEVAEFEIKYAERVDEDAKILALQSIIPETLFGEAGVFRGRSFSTYAELRTAIIRYLDDKVPVSMITKSSSASATTSLVQNLIEGERETEEEDKQQFRKGKGECKGKGLCWNCGESDHYCRNCPVDKQISWTETMSWKGQQDTIKNKGARKGWDAGESMWNRAEGKGKYWQMEVVEGQI